MEIQMSKNTGTVKWFNAQKGYGFILPSEGGKDVFMHVSGLSDGFTPNDNQKVQYEMDQDRNGREVAVNVHAV
jgi:CspA family cold shock protein